jgi:hypothetical protein
MLYWVYYCDTLVAICASKETAADLCIEDGYWLVGSHLPKGIGTLNLSLIYSPAPVRSYERNTYESQTE